MLPAIGTQVWVPNLSKNIRQGAKERHRYIGVFYIFLLQRIISRAVEIVIALTIVILHVKV